jgi:hypothetical protein
MDGIDNQALRKWRRRAIATWILMGLLAVLALMTMFVMAATDDDDNIALSRNEVVQAPTGGRIWRGTFWNHTDSLYTDLDAIILFVDSDGRPVGQAQGAAAKLDPGEVFHLESPLPAGAARMQVYRLRWRREGGPRAALGPYQPRPFGYVTDTECGETRLKIGSCAEQREQ